MLDYLIESVRRNIQTRLLRWALVLTMGVLRAVFAIPSSGPADP